MRWILAAAVLLAGCAASPARPPTAATCGARSCDEQDAELAYAELRRIETEFHTLDAQPAEPNCIKVQALRANICALANLICQIADQQPAGSLTHERCRDGKARCTYATERGQAHCGWKK